MLEHEPSALSTSQVVVLSSLAARSEARLEAAHAQGVSEASIALTSPTRANSAAAPDRAPLLGPAAEPPRTARRVASRCWSEMAPDRVSR
jgi:hypothetical protein